MTHNMTALEATVEFLQIPYRLDEKSNYYKNQLKNTKFYIDQICFERLRAEISTKPHGKERKHFAWVYLEQLTVFTE